MCGRRTHTYTYCLCPSCKILLGEAEEGDGTVVEKEACFLRWTLIICPVSGYFTEADGPQAYEENLQIPTGLCNNYSTNFLNSVPSFIHSNTMTVELQTLGSASSLAFSVDRPWCFFNRCEILLCATSLAYDDFCCIQYEFSTPSLAPVNNHLFLSPSVSPTPCMLGI